MDAHETMTPGPTMAPCPQCGVLTLVSTWSHTQGWMPCTPRQSPLTGLAHVCTPPLSK
jgi:hypothetical protein